MAEAKGAEIELAVCQFLRLIRLGFQCSPNETQARFDGHNRGIFLELLIWVPISLQPIFISLIVLLSSIGAQAVDPRCKEIISKTAKAPGNYDWPVKVKWIGATIGFFKVDRNFHRGVDARADAGSPVCLPFDATLTFIEAAMGGLDIYLKDNQGYEWGLAHLDEHSIPKNILDAGLTKKQTLLPRGTFLGLVHKWPSDAFGERFHHLHILVGKKGMFGRKYSSNPYSINERFVANPFSLFKKLPDRDKPEILEISLFKRHWTNANRIEDAVVKKGTKYSVLVRSRDLIMHDKYYVPPYKVAYSINGMNEKTVVQFDSLPVDPEKNYTSRFLRLFLDKQDSCKFPDECRHFDIDLGFKEIGRTAFPTEPGRYSIRVAVEDFIGNKAEKNFSWEVVD